RLVEGLGPQLVVRLPADPRGADQLGRLQGGEVLGDPLARHRELRREPAGRDGAAARQGLHDPAARGVGERDEDCVDVSVSRCPQATSAKLSERSSRARRGPQPPAIAVGAATVVVPVECIGVSTTVTRLPPGSPSIVNSTKLSPSPGRDQVKANLSFSSTLSTVPKRRSSPSPTEISPP